MTLSRRASVCLVSALCMTSLAVATHAGADSGADAQLRMSLAQPRGDDEQVTPDWAAVFQRRVQACWVVDPTRASGRLTVTLGFDLDREGRVVADSLSLLRASGGDAADVQAAYDSARRAVLRCQSATGDGYDLPPELYDRWKRVELTFDPGPLPPG